MARLLEVRVIHSYDTERHRVRCGVREQSNSTKHERDVSCVTCRELLDRSDAQMPVRAVAGIDPSGP